jgi:hypothetical protein
VPWAAALLSAAAAGPSDGNVRAVVGPASVVTLWASAHHVAAGADGSGDPQRAPAPPESHPARPKAAPG